MDILIDITLFLFFFIQTKSKPHHSNYRAEFSKFQENFGPLACQFLQRNFFLSLGSHIFMTLQRILIKRNIYANFNKLN